MMSNPLNHSNPLPFSLITPSDPLDYMSDHIHTNFKDLYDHLRNGGYFIEVLGYPLTCFDAKEYGTLLIVDPEREFSDEEIAKLQKDYHESALSLIVFADWYNTTIMQKVQFFNENTRQLWRPETGGSNIPAINNLLKPWNISFGDLVFEGDFKLGGHEMYYASGSSITSFPADGLQIRRNLNDQGKEIIDKKLVKLKDVPILGLYSTEFNKKQQNLHPPIRKHSEGRIAVYGDSSCLDSAHLQKDCFWMLEALLQFTTTGTVPFIFQHSHQNSMDDSSKLKPYAEVPVATPFSNKTSKTDQINCSLLEWEGPIVVNQTLPNNMYRAQKSILLSNLEWSNLPDVPGNLEEIDRLERNGFKQVLEYESGKAGQLDEQVNSGVISNLYYCLLLLSAAAILYMLARKLKFGLGFFWRAIRSFYSLFR